MESNIDFAKRVERVSADLVGTLKRKNADYGDSFAVLFKKIGMPYAYGHLAEKLERVWSLMNKDAQVKNESLVDSLRDLAGYAILTLCNMDEDEHNKKEEHSQFSSRMYQEADHDGV